ncbi:hypothetical protein NX059_004227 [Plenodomus lindquistii]|nr:hypothetical protein NX059_004227 [Plenodomus lindquistii]
MQSLRRTAVAAARTSRSRTNLPRQTRRFAHDDHGHGHGHASVEEPMGTGFYSTIAIIPAGILLYYMSRKTADNEQPYFTRMINRVTEGWNEQWTAQNDLHVRMLEQAGEDRVLFLKTAPVHHVEMKFPEIMNVGSPYNVVAGSQVDMKQVIEKYKKLSDEDNERKLQALRENKIKSEQPFEGKTRARKAPDMF